MQMSTKWLQHDVVRVELNIPFFFYTINVCFVSIVLYEFSDIVLIVLATFLFIKCSHNID